MENQIVNIAIDLGVLVRLDSIAKIHKMGRDAGVEMPPAEMTQMIKILQGTDVQILVMGNKRTHGKLAESLKPTAHLTEWLERAGVVGVQGLKKDDIAFEDDIVSMIAELEFDTFITANESTARQAANQGIENVFLIQTDGGRMAGDTRITVFTDLEQLKTDVAQRTMPKARTKTVAAIAAA